MKLSIKFNQEDYLYSLFIHHSLSSCHDLHQSIMSQSKIWFSPLLPAVISPWTAAALLHPIHQLLIRSRSSSSSAEGWSLLIISRSSALSSSLHHHHQCLDPIGGFQYFHEFPFKYHVITMASNRQRTFHILTIIVSHVSKLLLFTQSFLIKLQHYPLPDDVVTPLFGLFKSITEMQITLIKKQTISQ